VIYLSKPPAHVTGCNCADDAAHAALVRNVDASYLQDPERARERHERTTAALRARALATGNGHAKQAS
jgi:hypothetical protein